MIADPSFIGFGLHDAILEQIMVDWPAGSVELRFSAVVPTRETVIILAIGLVELRCPRRQPWGTGENMLYVNDVYLRDGSGSEAKALEIEMCSGDVIAIIASSFSRSSNVAPGSPGGK